MSRKTPRRSKDGNKANKKVKGIPYLQTRDECRTKKSSKEMIKRESVRQLVDSYK